MPDNLDPQDAMTTSKVDAIQLLIQPATTKPPSKSGKLVLPETSALPTVLLEFCSRTGEQRQGSPKLHGHDKDDFAVEFSNSLPTDVITTKTRKRTGDIESL